MQPRRKNEIEKRRYSLLKKKKNISRSESLKDTRNNHKTSMLYYLLTPEIPEITPELLNTSPEITRTARCYGM